MSKYINQVVAVFMEENLPVRFFYHSWYLVKEIQDYWRETGEWWQGELELHVFLLHTQKGCCELHHTPKDVSSPWVLYRIED